MLQNLETRGLFDVGKKDHALDYTGKGAGKTNRGRRKAAEQTIDVSTRF